MPYATGPAARSVTGGAPVTDLAGLDVPGVDFAALARGYGLPYRRVAAPDEIQPGLAAAFASGVPNVVEIEIDPLAPELLPVS